jgi:thymidylate synthase (FAD)
MRIVNPSYEFITPLNRDAILKRIEEAGRVCYLSEDKIEKGSAERFVKMIMNKNHTSVIEHISLTVKFVTDRGIGNELVRHRIASYSQVSTRYVNYSDDKFGNEISVVMPSMLDSGALQIMWEDACLNAERSYLKLIENCVKPEIARSVLPLCTATTIVMTADLREWRHVLQLRCAPAAHPDMRALMKPLLQEFKKELPEIFSDVGEQEITVEQCAEFLEQSQREQGEVDSQFE